MIWKIIVTDYFSEFIHQVPIKFRFWKALQKKCFQSDIIFRHDVKMPPIKFWKRLTNFMISISLSEKFCCQNLIKSIKNQNLISKWDHKKSNLNWDIFWKDYFYFNRCTALYINTVKVFIPRRWYNTLKKGKQQSFSSIWKIVSIPKWTSNTYHHLECNSKLIKWLAGLFYLLYQRIVMAFITHISNKF